MLWWNDEILIWWHADKKTRSHNDKMTFWPVDKMTFWHVDILTCWYVDMITCWHGDMTTRWNDGMMAWWHDDMLTWWHVDMMTWWGDQYDMMTWWHDDMIQCLLSHAQIWVRSITWFWAPKFETTTQRLTYLLTRVKSRDASASKNSALNAFHTWLPARAVKPNLLQSSRSCSSIGMRGTTIIVIDPVQD